MYDTWSAGRMAVDEDELPEMLREAIQKARHRASQDASSDSEDTGRAAAMHLPRCVSQASVLFARMRQSHWQSIFCTA